MADDTIPDDRSYTAEHEWATVADGVVRVGITHFAQDQLGDVVYVDLPPTGTKVEHGQAFGEVESTKSVSDLYAPATGVIEERNDALEDQPDLVNSDCYGDGWLVAIRLTDGADVPDLLDAEAYAALLP